MQIEVITAKFNKGSHGYWFSPNGFDVHKGDMVIVDTEKGRDMVKVTKDKELIENDALVEPLKNVVKIATDAEIKQAEENYKRAQSLLPEVKAIVDGEQLDMKVIAVESNYNFSRLTVHFTAENRVDFRELVKKLAEKFKVRIELRQIGPRDSARLLGGYGPCGLVCCCSNGFGVNDHITIKMAKNQGLSLNPSSINGVCGKMLCCLAYENQYYTDVLKVMPKVGARVKTPDGDGKVVYNDLLKKSVSVRFDSDESSEIRDYPVEQLQQLGK